MTELDEYLSCNAGFLSTCPMCGTLHDDGALMRINGRPVYLCHDCADDFDEDPEKFAARLKRVQNG